MMQKSPKDRVYAPRRRESSPDVGLSGSNWTSGSVESTAFGFCKLGAGEGDRSRLGLVHAVEVARLALSDGDGRDGSRRL